LRERELSRPAHAIATAHVMAAPRSATLVHHHKRLPVLVAAERAWVLHKDLVLRIATIALAALLVASLVQARNHIFTAGVAVVEAASTGLASAGFGISAIDITGQALTREATILSALAIAPQTSLLAFDAEAARQRLLELPAVTDAEIRKVYPDRLMISVSEKAPVARWSVDGQTFLVDEAGTRLVDVPIDADADLPLVIGQGAGDDAAALIHALDRFPALNRDILALSRIGDRRWDVLYDTGLRLQLPETGVTQALRQLDRLESDHAILERDLALIDLRVPGNVIVRLTVREDEPQ